MVKRLHRHKPILTLAAGLLFPILVAAGPADTAWVDLFNGKNFAGLYVFNFNGGNVIYDSSLAGNALFKPDSASKEIRVTSSDGQRGHIATKKDYSYFRMKVDWKISSGNCGVMYHLREDLAIANPLTRLYDVFPPSIEAQGETGNGGDCWVISNVWMNTKATNGKYSATGTPITFGGVNAGGRNISADVHWDLYGTANTKGGWNTEEIIIYGADSVVHIVNGHANFRGSNILYTPGNAPTSANPPSPPYSKIPFDHGHLSLQAEMATVAYRNWKVAELIGCTDPKADNYKSYFVKSRSTDCIFTTSIATQKKTNLNRTKSGKNWKSLSTGKSGNRTLSGRLLNLLSNTPIPKLRNP